MGGTTTIIARSEGKFLRTVLQIIVFEFDGPVVGERMFNTNTEEKTIQSATGRRRQQLSVERISNLPQTQPALP
jgi:hypothetical protein